MIRRVMWLAAGAWAASAAGQTLEIKGFPLGGSVSDLRSRYPELECGTTYCRVDPMRVMAAQCRGAESERPACRDAVLKRYSWGPLVAGVWTFGVEDGRVGSFTVTFLHQQFSALRTALTEKYGPPTRSVNVPVQNRMGATFDSTELRWQLPDGAIVVRERDAKVDEGSAGMVATWYADALAAKENSRAKGSAKNL